MDDRLTRLLLALALLGLALVAGCGEDDGGAASASSLEGVPWVLASGLDVAGWESVAPSATFAKGTVSGSSGCNQYTASYKVDGDQLDLGDIASTQMACPAPADAVERAYLAALGKVTGWRVAGGELVLLGSGGAELLRFRTASPIGSWTATAFLQGDGVSSPLTGTEVTASFDDSGKLSGSAGCNTYTATFTTDNGAIKISEPAATRMACASPAGVMEQEHAYLTALPKAVSYTVAGSTLSLLTAEGTFVATYTRTS